MKSTLELLNALNSLDWIVFSLVIALTFYAVFYGQKSKKESTSENNMIDFLLMGRRLTLPLFTATLVATWYGGIFGVTEIAFNSGVYNFVTQGFFWYITYIIFAFFLVKKVHQFEAVTLPDMIGKMFGKKSAYLSAVFNFFNVVPISYTISLGLFIQAFTNYSLLASMVIGVTLVLCYSLYGGFRAVVFSDLVQFFVMCSSVALVLIFSVYTFGGIEFLQNNLPKNHFSLTGGNSVSVTLVWGFIALSTLIDPNFYQRCFAAKSPQVAKKGILIATGIWIIFDICTTAGAMYAKATIPEADSAKAYLIYAIQILPNGLRGFVLAGILATILSTLDSYLFLAGTTLSFDIFKKKSNLLFHHLAVVLVGILSILMAISFDGNIKMVWKTLGSYSSACLLLPVLCGHIFPGRISDKQFVTASLFGVIATTYWRNASHSGFYANIDELYAGMLATLLVIIPSLFFQKKSKKYV